MTIIEVLVSIGIILLLLALVLPSVQSSRATARRLQCQSQLRQIGLALHSYHGIHGGFPPGYSPWRVMADSRWLSWYSTYAWSAHLLPHLGEGGLYAQLDINHVSLEEAVDDPAKASLLQLPLPIFRCPSDLIGDTRASGPLKPLRQVLDRDGGINGDVVGTVAGGASSYVASCGYFATYHPAAATAGTLLPHKQERTGPNNGLFYTGSYVRMADITDGASQTIAIGERAWYQGSSTWVGTANLLGSGPASAPVCLGRVYWRINEIPDSPGVQLTPDSELTLGDMATGRECFGSYHAGGANFLFADGSVHFLSDNIDSRNTTPDNVTPPEGIADLHLLGTFQRMGIRNDGMALDAF